MIGVLKDLFASCSFLRSSWRSERKSEDDDDEVDV